MLAGFVLLTALQLYGQNGTAYYLDVNGTTGGFGSPSGTYNENGNYWSTSSAGTAATGAFPADQQLTFGNTGSDFAGATFTIALNSNSWVGLLINSTSANITLNGTNNAFLNGSQTWTVAAGSTLNEADMWSGGGLNFNNTSTLLLNGGGTINFNSGFGYNSYSTCTQNASGLTVNMNATAVGTQGTDHQMNYTLTAGTLNFASTKASGAFNRMRTADGSQVTLNGGVIDNTSGSAITLDLYQGTYIFSNSFTFTGTNGLNLGPAAIALQASPTITVNNGTLSMSGAISGAYNLTKAGSGTLVLANSETYSGGATTVTAGTLKMGNAYRYVKFQVDSAQAGSASFIQMSELEFYSSGTNHSGGTRIVPTGYSFNGSYNTGEDPTKLYDNSTATKYCDQTASSYPQYVTFDFGSSKVITGYDWCTANDNTPGRNPYNWTVMGSNDNSTWIALDSKVDTGNSPNTTTTWAVGWALPTNGTLPSATALSIASGATFDMVGSSQTVGSLADYSGAGGSVTNAGISDATLTINGSSSTSFGGVISDGGTNKTAVTKNGSSTLTFTGSNTYTGTTLISGGTLQLGNGGTSGRVSNSSNITNNSALIYNRSNSSTYSGAISGSGTVTQNGAGAEALTGTNTYTGTTTIAAGTLNANATAALGNGSSTNTLIFTGGTLQAAGTITSPSTRTVTLTSTGLIDNNGQAISIAGIISGAGGLTKSGAGKLTLTGANTYTGTTAINTDTLKIQGVAFSTTARTYSISSGTTLNIDGNTNVASGTTIINGTGTLYITGGTLDNPSGTGHNITMSLGSGGLIDVETGATMNNGGWQDIDWTSNLASLNVDGTFNVDDGNTATVDALTGGGTVTKSNAGAKTLSIGVNNGSGTFGGVINNGSGTVALTKNGSGAQTLSGASTPIRAQQPSMPAL